MTVTEFTIETIALHKAAQNFRAANHKLRQEMLHLLHKNKKMTVTEIYVKLRLEQSVTSQQLAILRNARLVQTEKREDTFTIPSITKEWRN